MTVFPRDPGAAKVRLKSIALPVQHGGWGFWFEPVLLGLLLAPSWAGVALSAAGLGAFLMHQPLKLAVKDRLKGKYYARTLWAERFTLGYGALALLGLLLAFRLAANPFILPLLLAVPLALIQLWYEFRGEGREVPAELAGAATFGAIAPALILMSMPDADLPFVLAIWIALIARSVPSILYVRARLRLEYGKPFDRMLPIIAHLIAGLVVSGLVLLDSLPLTVLAGVLLLTGRTLLGLSRYHRPAQPRSIGFREIAFGVVYVVLIAGGVRLV